MLISPIPASLAAENSMRRIAHAVFKRLKKDGAPALPGTPPWAGQTAPCKNSWPKVFIWNLRVIARERPYLRIRRMEER